MIVLAILLITVSLTFWRSLTTKVEQTVAMQVDYEDAALCAKFGLHTALKSMMLASSTSSTCGTATRS